MILYIVILVTALAALTIVVMRIRNPIITPPLKSKLDDVILEFQHATHSIFENAFFDELSSSTGLSEDQLFELFVVHRVPSFDECVRLAPLLKQSVTATLRDAGLLPQGGEEITAGDLKHVLKKDGDLQRSLKTYIGAGRWKVLLE